MATKPMNLDTTTQALPTPSKTKWTSLDRWLADKQAWAPAALRAPLGVILFAHGAQKVFGWFGGYGWNGSMEYFEQTLHIPAPFAIAAFLIELIGGLALLGGFLTRWAAIFVAGEMLVAAVKVHLPNGFFLNWSNTPNQGHGIEYSLLVIGTAIALAIIGGGRYSVDAKLRKAS